MRAGRYQQKNEIPILFDFRNYDWFFLIGHCQTCSASQSPQWKGKIETIDGERIMHNSSEPLYGYIKT